MEVMSAVETRGVPLAAPSRRTYASVLCCVCGCSLPSPSPQSICLVCLAQQTDITEGISRNVVLPCCGTCGRYMHAQNRWLPCELESRELMVLMLQKIRGLKKIAKVVDSNWVWREPHCRRVTLKLTVQKEILDGRASVQQAVLVEGIIQNTQCDDCKKSYTPHAGWTAMVQVRQHADHKRTLLYLEQLVLKHQLASRLLNVVEKPDGLDFCFPSRQTALQFSAFCESRFPCTTKQSKQLISHDASSNTHFHKYTISITLAALCRDDLVYVDRKQAHVHLGGFPSLAICSRVAGAGVQLLDPFTGRTTHVSVEKYWRAPFHPLCTRKHLSSFLVLDVTPVDPPTGRSCGGQRLGESASQQQQQQHAQAAGGGSRRSRRRRQVLDGGVSGGTEDEEWEKELGGRKRKREKRTVAAWRKKHLEAAVSNSRRSTGVSAAVRSCSASVDIDFCASSNSTFSLAAEQDVQVEASMLSSGTCIELSPVKGGRSGIANQTHSGSRKLQLCEMELMRGCDVGVCDRRVITRTHLGGALQPGDWVQGYDLRSINLAGAVDCQLEEDARFPTSARSQQSRRTRRHAGGRATCSKAGMNGIETENDTDDVAVEAETECSNKHDGTSSARGTSQVGAGSADRAEDAFLVDSGRLHQNEEADDENSLLRCIQFEVVIVKKQPLQRLCAAADGCWQGKAAAERGGSSSAKKGSRGSCKVRPWVLQTLQKKRDASFFTGQPKRGKQWQGGSSGGHTHGEECSDAEMEAFKDELEEDPEMRAQVNLWKDPRYSGKTAKKNAARSAKNADRRSKDIRRKDCTAPAERGEGDLKQLDTHDAVNGDDETAKNDDDAEAWEDYNSDVDAAADDGEAAGVKLAELLEGLTLENGKLKGLVVPPGGGGAAAAESFGATLAVPDTDLGEGVGGEVPV